MVIFTFSRPCMIWLSLLLGALIWTIWLSISVDALIIWYFFYLHLAFNTHSRRWKEITFSNSYRPAQLPCSNIQTKRPESAGTEKKPTSNFFVSFSGNLWDMYHNRQMAIHHLQPARQRKWDKWRKQTKSREEKKSEGTG